MRTRASRILDFLALFFAVYCPFVILFIVYPTDVVLVNQQEFTDYQDSLRFFVLASAVSGVLCLIVSFFVFQANSTTQTAFLAYGVVFSVYLLLSDAFIPIRVDRHIGFSGSESLLRPPLGQIILDIVLLVSLFIAGWKLRNKPILSIGSFMLFTFVLSHIVVAYVELSDTAKVSDQARDLEDLWLVHRALPGQVADHPNVYHIILDGYNGTVLLDSMKARGLTEDDFDGFVYFPKNRSNYLGTQMSIPSLFSGTLYHSGALSDWYSAWYKNGMWNIMKEYYDTAMYSYTANNGYYGTPVNLHRRTDTDEEALRRRSQKTINIVLHLSLARMAPSFLHEFIFAQGRGMFGELVIEKGSRGSMTRLVDNLNPKVTPFRQMVDEERDRLKRGQYVFLHIFIPHWPFVLDKDCSYYPELESGGGNYYLQATCVTGMLHEFLEELRRLGKYENSIVLIHADHGWPGVGKPIEPLRGTPDERRIPEVDLVERDHRTADQLDKFTAALLLIKPAGQAGKPLIISERSTQLLDIPNTLFDLLSIPAKAPEGLSVFAEDYPVAPERHVYQGFRQWDRKADRQIWFGKDIFEGELNHFVWISGKGWEVRPNVPAVW